MAATSITSLQVLGSVAAVSRLSLQLPINFISWFCNVKTGTRTQYSSFDRCPGQTIACHCVWKVNVEVLFSAQMGSSCGHAEQRDMGHLCHSADVLLGSYRLACT